MEIGLQGIKIINFKGIRELQISFSHYTQIFGDNETGKTTICDAFKWLLFDKDSENKSVFNIKTLDADGQPIHNLNHEVEGTLTVDIQPVTFRKVFKEKWTQKRGSVSKEFSGHTTDYFVDGVPVKAKEYKDRVAEIVDETVFPLLTDPMYFNTVLKWETRRETLLQVSGDVSTGDVIAANEKLATLPDILGNRTIDDQRKVILAQRKEINDELQRIPVRIDEANRSKPNTEGLDKPEIKRRIEQLKTQVSLKDAEIARLQSGGEITVAENRVRELEGELLDLKNNAKSDVVDQVAEQRKIVYDLEESVRWADADIQRKNREIDGNCELIKKQSDKAQELRELWVEGNAEQFSVNDDHDPKCPACGQSLPPEQIQAAHDKAAAEFNRRKSERLEDIKARGTVAVDKANEYALLNRKLESEIETLESELQAHKKSLESEKSKLEALQAQVTDVTKSPVYIAKHEELDHAKNRVVALRSSVLDDVDKVRKERLDLSDEMSGLESKLSWFDQVERLDQRIADLSTQEKKLSAKFENLERQLSLLDEFTRTRVDLLESKINSKFKVARFKLFADQINGGLKETCETLYKGVPYSDMNNAARINVGLDIINTLSEHYGVHAPIFIDNAEAVSQLYETDSQMIALYVSPDDKQLRIETLEEAI